MITLSASWAPKLLAQPETGMGYQGRISHFERRQAFRPSRNRWGYLTRIKGLKDIPFSEGEIAEILVTHDKWILMRSNDFIRSLLPLDDLSRHDP